MFSGTEIFNFFVSDHLNGIPLWHFYLSDFQRALKIMIIAELFIVMTISTGQLRQDNSDNAEKCSFTIVRPYRLDLCDIPLLTICKLYKHVICEINIEINVLLTSGLGLMYTYAFTVSCEKGFVNYAVSANSLSF